MLAVTPDNDSSDFLSHHYATSLYTILCKKVPWYVRQCRTGGAPIPAPPILMSLVHAWPGGWYWEHLGSGIRLILGALQATLLPTPELQEECGDLMD